MRGKHCLRPEERPRVGLIPAYAGKTQEASIRVAPLGAHPRVCGENGIVVASFGRVTGSSPRMRGKRSGAWEAAKNVGLIPAYAGKTLWVGGAVNFVGAHPRVCGENLRDDLDALGAKGSSPRMRGKRPRSW